MFWSPYHHYLFYAIFNKIVHQNKIEEAASLLLQVEKLYNKELIESFMNRIETYKGDTLYELYSNHT